MYARLSTFKGAPGDPEAGLELAQTTLLPEARVLDGWRGCLNLVDGETGADGA